MPCADNDNDEQALEMHKADSADVLLTVTEDEADEDGVYPPVRLDLAVDGTASRHAILRWAVKRSPKSDDNVDALVYKDSQRGPSEIRLSDQVDESTRGQAEAFIDPTDTSDSDDPTVSRDDDALHRHDYEVNRQDFVRDGVSGVGTVSVVDGSDVVTGVGTAFLLAKRLDILNLVDVDNVLRPALITSIVSNTELRVGRTSWVTATGVAFEVRRNRRKTVLGGPFKLLTEVVSDD